LTYGIAPDTERFNNYLISGENIMHVIRNVIVLMLIMIMCSGCALLIVTAVGGGAAVGAIKYVKGEMEGSYASTIGSTWIACEAALKELGIDIFASVKETPTHWMLKGRSEGGKKVKVTLDALPDKVTKVSVRVGIFGDKQLSKKIHNAISRRLG